MDPRDWRAWGEIAPPDLLDDFDGFSSTEVHINERGRREIVIRIELEDGQEITVEDSCPRSH